jgi:hypothetical protein
MALEILFPGLELRLAILPTGNTVCSKAMKHRFIVGVVHVDGETLRSLLAWCCVCCLNEDNGGNVIWCSSRIVLERREEIISVFRGFASRIGVNAGP